VCAILLKSVSTFIFIGLAFFAYGAWASERPTTVFNLRTFESPLTAKSGYTYSIFKLALEYTKEQYGPYEINLLRGMNRARSIKTAKENAIQNFYFTSGYHVNDVQGLNYAQVPIVQGALGYRVCFCHKDQVANFAKIRTLNELKNYSIGQGVDWPDINVLQDNGFNVVEASHYDSLFHMLSRKRFDLLCRGINELKLDTERYKRIPNIAEETSFVLYYPSPRFFWTNDNNKPGLERINTGLIAAFQQGALQAMFNKEYRGLIDQISLGSRKIYYLENNNLRGLNPAYKRFYTSLPVHN